MTRIISPKRTQSGAALLMAMVIVTLVATLAASMVWQQWRATGLADSGRVSPYTTQASTQQLIGWAGKLHKTKP